MIGGCDATVNARKLYESALNIYGQNRDLWKEYYILETKVMHLFVKDDVSEFSLP